MSEVKGLDSEAAFSLGISVEMSVEMIVQGEERNPETSVNILLFAGSRISVCPSRAVPV
jgi:hypothetical protein